MGYPENKQAFRALADTLLLTKLIRLVPAKIRKYERALHYQALLFGISGLMDNDAEKKPGSVNSGQYGRLTGNGLPVRP